MRPVIWLLPLLLPSLVPSLVLSLAPSLASAREENDPDTEIARRHFNVGRTFYEQADYEHALEEFESANKVRPAPAFDYNIGRCHDRLEHLPQAIASYQRYVDANPVDAAEVRDRIRVLAARQAEAEAAAEAVRQKEATQQRAEPQKADDANKRAREQAAPPLTTPPPKQGHSPSLVAPLVVGALALVAAAAGTALVVTVAPDYNALASGPGRCQRPCDPSLIDPLKTRADLGYALFGLAGAAAATDVVLWVLALRGHGVDKPAHALLVVPTLGGALAEGTF